MNCPIESCPIPATPLGLCSGHFKLIPKPIQSEIYGLVKRHKGGPAHQAAIRRGCVCVTRTLAEWAKNRGPVPEPAPTLPY